MADRRIFTLEEANALLPRISALVAEQLDRRSALESRLAELARLTGSPPDTITEEPNDPPDIRTAKRELAARIGQYQTGWNELESMGAVLKDARTGLIDFYGRVEGKLVFLCWKYGEDAITHYHDLDTGFSARKPIEGAVRTRLYN